MLQMQHNSIKIHELLNNFCVIKMSALEDSGQAAETRLQCSVDRSLLLKQIFQHWTKEPMCVVRTEREIHTCVYTPHTDRSRYTDSQRSA